MNQSAAVAPHAKGDIRLGHLRELLGYSLRRAHVRAFNDFAATMGPFKLSPGQLGLLLLVEANPGANQSALARAIGLDRSTLVSLIDTLEARGLLSRRPSKDDRRSHAIVLEPEGERFLEEITPALRAHEDRIAAGLTDAERDTLRRLLNRLDGR